MLTGKMTAKYTDENLVSGNQTKRVWSDFQSKLMAFHRAYSKKKSAYKTPKLKTTITSQVMYCDKCHVDQVERPVVTGTDKEESLTREHETPNLIAVNKDKGQTFHLGVI